MPPLTLRVVFDTNAYVGVNHEALPEIIALESATGVLSLASVWSCIELVARCADTNTSMRRRAHSGLRKIAAHAGGETASGTHLRLHEAGEFSLMRGLFGTTTQEPLLDIRYVGHLALAASEGSLESFCSEYTTPLVAVADRVRLEEQRFVAMMAAGRRAYPTARFGPKVARFDLQLIAAGLVKVLAEQNNIELTPVNSGPAVEMVVQIFPVALTFMCGLMTDYSEGAGVPGQPNSHWDLKMAFHASRGMALGAPVLLVSDDRRLRRAARDASEPLRVVRLSEYQSLLRSPDAVLERSAALRR